MLVDVAQDIATARSLETPLHFWAYELFAASVPCQIVCVIHFTVCPHRFRIQVHSSYYHFSSLSLC